MRTTGQKLEGAMRLNGVSKRQLERMTGIAYTTICRICNGDRVGYLDTWIRVCDALGIELSEIVNEEE